MTQKPVGMSSVSWRIAAACQAGFQHTADGTDCQDHYAAEMVGDWFIGVVSDGASTATRSGEGAAAICEGVASHLAAQTSVLRLDPSTSGSEVTVREAVEEAIDSVRRKLLGLSSGQAGSLQEFGATVLGVVANAAGGAFFHIGDGAACAIRVDGATQSVTSPPENGEYANETYFFTQDCWCDHLRITLFGPKYDVIVLMTDGVTAFGLGPGGLAPFMPFLDPVSRFLCTHSRAEGEQALAKLLEKDEIRSITADDKTFLWASRVRAAGL